MELILDITADCDIITLEKCVEFWLSVVKDIEHISEFHGNTLTKLREILISRITKPTEVLITVNNLGAVVYESPESINADANAINLHRNMREALIQQARLDIVDTKRIMVEKLNKLINGTDRSWKNINTLCWSISCISGTLLDERQFVVCVLKKLLDLCEHNKDDVNIVFNVMFVAGEMAHFLAGESLLKVVVDKLMELMHLKCNGAQEMAVDTFKKIAQKCAFDFIIIQPNQLYALIDEILPCMSDIILDLQPKEVKRWAFFIFLFCS